MLTPWQVEDLEYVFRARFRFNTTIVALDASSRPQHQMDRSLATFVEQNDGPRNLLIVYYTGPGAYREDQKHLELWSEFGPRLQRRRSPPVNWHRSEEMLRSDEVDGDVLTIDTPHESKQLTNRMTEDNSPKRMINRTRRFELMTAFEFYLATARPGKSSFTRALTNALTALLDQNVCNPFSTFSLNQRIRGYRPRSARNCTHCSLLPNRNHIFLTPTRSAAERAAQHQSEVKGYLKLGFEFSDDSLSHAQIEKLIKKLAVIGDDADIGLQRIEWLGFQTKQGQSYHSCERYT